MAVTGRKRKPTALRVLQGNPGKRPLPENEPVAPVGERTPGVPRHLKGDARRAWRKVAPVLHNMRVLTDADLHALEAYCVAYARWRKAEDELALGNYVIKTDKGNLVQSPWVGIANKAMDQMRRFMVEFGMTPSSRARVKVEPKAAADPFKEFMERRKQR